MAKLKMPKKPRKPKATASVATKEAYLKKYSDWQKECNRRKALNKKSDTLTKRIASLK